MAPETAETALRKKLSSSKETETEYLAAAGAATERNEDELNLTNGVTVQ